jgi:hypothetical protein
MAQRLNINVLVILQRERERARTKDFRKNYLFLLKVVDNQNDSSKTGLLLKGRQVNRNWFF